MVDTVLNIENHMSCDPVRRSPYNRSVVTPHSAEAYVEDGITRLQLQTRLCVSFRCFHNYLIDLHRQAQLIIVLHKRLLKLIKSGRYKGLDQNML